jgi:PPOX class probable F420-dependent enzyme
LSEAHRRVEYFLVALFISSGALDGLNNKEIYMPAIIPESHRDLIDGPVLVTVATIMPDGQPQLSVIWCSSDDDFVLINTVRGRQKAKNIARDPRVTIFAFDPDDPYRFLEVRGVVEDVTEEGAVEHISELARLYTDHPAYYGHFAPGERRQEETRMICRVRPTRVRTG